MPSMHFTLVEAVCVPMAAHLGKDVLDPVPRGSDAMLARFQGLGERAGDGIQLSHL